MEPDIIHSGKKCAQCESFLGLGDFDLCCSNQDGKRLCYSDTPACSHFKQTQICRDVSSKVGYFVCSICGKECKSSDVDKRCPNCGNDIIY